MATSLISLLSFLPECYLSSRNFSVRGFGVRQIWVGILAPPLTGDLQQDMKWLHFLTCQKDNKNWEPISRGLCKNEMILKKRLAQCLMYSKHSINVWFHTWLVLSMYLGVHSFIQKYIHWDFSTYRNYAALGIFRWAKKQGPFLEPNEGCRCSLSSWSYM